MVAADDVTGPEEGSRDVWRVAQSLAAAGADLKVYVVGFDVDGDAVAQLECIAEKGGGRFFQAVDAASLAQALTAIQEHVMEAKALPEPTPPQEPVLAPDKPDVEVGGQETTKIRIKGPGTINLKPAPWVRMPPRTWTLVDAESGEEKGQGTGESIRVAPGVYQIVWEQAQHLAGPVALTETIQVASGATVDVPLDTGLRITPPKNLPPPHYMMLVTAQGEEVARFWEQEAYEAQLVPAGQYRLVWRQSQHGSWDVPLGFVTIETGKLTEKVLDTGIGVSLPKWLDPPYAFALKDGQGAEYAFSDLGLLPMAPGEYELIWRQTQHGHSPTSLGMVAVTPGEYVTLPVNAGITFTPFGDTPPYRFIFRDLDTDNEYVLSESWGPMPLGPGRYAVSMQETQHGSSPMVLVEELEVKAGTLLELEM